MNRLKQKQSFQIPFNDMMEHFSDLKVHLEVEESKSECWSSIHTTQNNNLTELYVAGSHIAILLSPL